jgi:hypothetical protein
MSDSYKVKVNDSFQFDFDKEQISRLDAVNMDTNTFHVLHENKPYKAEILSADFNHKTYTVKVNNNSYTVAISNDLDQLIHELGFEVGLTKQINAIKRLCLDIGNQCNSRANGKRKRQFVNFRSYENGK